jgi:hypothetical protein
VWIALHALGLPATFVTALILESVAQGIRDVMFLVPGAVDVQEGGYLVFGGLLGIAAETALALSLIRRVRELALGVPGLIAWQLFEGRHLLPKGPTRTNSNSRGIVHAAQETRNSDERPMMRIK